MLLLNWFMLLVTLGESSDLTITRYTLVGVGLRASPFFYLILFTVGDKLCLMVIQRVH